MITDRSVLPLITDRSICRYIYIYIYISSRRLKTQRRSEDRELNQARSKPNTVNRPVRTAHTFVHNYNSTQYCNTETVFSIFPILQTKSWVGIVRVLHAFNITVPCHRDRRHCNHCIIHSNNGNISVNEHSIDHFTYTQLHIAVKSIHETGFKFKQQSTFLTITSKKATYHKAKNSQNQTLTPFNFKQKLT